jgi:MFS transporter, DHA1 family, inner membrane transport protein
MGWMGNASAARDAAAEATRGRVVLLVLASVQFTSIIDFMIVMPLGPQLMDKLAIDPMKFGWIVSSYTIAASLAGLFAASFMDRFDRKTAFLTLYTGFLLGTLCCGLAPNYYLLLASRVVTGAFGGILGGLALAIIGDVFPEEKRGAANGVLMSAFAIASVVGIPFGLELGRRYGWHAPFVMLAALGLVILPAGWRALPRLGNHLDGARKANPLSELRTLMTHPDHLGAFGLLFLLMIGGFCVIPYMPTYLVENVGVREGDLSWMYVVGGGLSLLASPWIGKLADRHGKFQVYRVVAPLSAVVMITVTTLPRVALPIAIAVAASLFVCNAGRMVVAMTMITSCVEPRRRGSFMSLNSSVQHFSAGVGAAIGGQIIGREPSGALTRYGIVGLIALVTTLLSIAFAARLRPYSADSAYDLDSAPLENVGPIEDAALATSCHGH